MMLLQDHWPEYLDNITRRIYRLLPGADTRPAYDELDEAEQRRWLTAAAHIWDMCTHDG